MRRLERAGLAGAAAAMAAGVITIAACSKQVSGTAEVNQSDLAAYTSEAAAASSSRAATVDRVTTAACDAFLTANGSSVRTFNDYIDASNSNAPNAESKASDAVAKLRDNARELNRKVTREVPSSVADPLRAYRDETNALADTLERRADTDALNGVIDRFNATKDTALSACEGHR